MGCRVLCAAAVLSLALPCAAQRSQAIRLVEEGDALLQRGDVRGAASRFTQAVNVDRSYAAAHVRLGVLELRDGEMGNAEGHFSRALKAAPDHVEAHYYQGIVKREQGRLRPPLAGWLLAEWNASRRHFSFVIERDSTFRDVLYQFALLQQYRGDESRAIDLAFRQIVLKPEEAESIAGFFRMGRMFAATAKRDSDQWLAPLPTGHANLFTAELLRREGSLDDAERMLLRIQQTTTDVLRPMVHILLARIYAARGEDLGAQVQFWSAVEAIRSSGDAAILFDEVKYILTAEEIAQFRTLEDPDSYKRFFRAIWSRRDPMPAAAANVRLSEHFRRMNQAEVSFEHYLPRTWFNDPDVRHRLQFDEVYELNHQFNDRGLIFIRHGYPDERIFTSGEEGGSLSAFDGSTPTGAPGRRGVVAGMEPMALESWRYRAESDLPEMVFHFASRAGANWRLISAPMYPQALYDRRGWDHVYHDAFRAMVEGNDVDVPRLIHQMQRESQSSVSIALQTDRHSWPSSVQSLALPASIMAFRGEDGQTMVDVYYAFPTGPISQFVTSSADVPVEVGVAVMDREWNDVLVRRDRKLVQPSASPTDAAIGHFRFSVAPDSYLVSLHVQPEGMPLVGGWKSWRAFPDFRGGLLELSDLLLSTSIRPSSAPGPFTRGEIDVVPSFTRRFSVSQPVHLYFEMYNLTMEQANRTSYTTELELRPKDPPRRGPLGLFGRSRRPVLALRTEGSGRDPSPVENFEVDMSAVPAGVYTLSVRIRDVNSGVTVERQQDLELID